MNGLRRLLDHLPLLLVVARFPDRVRLVARVDAAVVREQVPDVLAPEDVLRERVARGPVARLLLELLHRVEPGAGRGLVRRDHGAVDAEGLVQREHGHVHQDRRAVGIRDDAAVARGRVPVHLGHDQRRALVHAERRAVVDHDAALGRRDRRVVLADVVAAAEQRDVHVVKGVLGQRLARERAPGELDLVAGFVRVRPHLAVVEGEVARLEALAHGDADGAGGTGDANVGPAQDTRQ